MLHLALTANVLNAVGGSPRVDSPRMLPGYPRTLPHGDQTFAMTLLPFGRPALELFARMERPAPLQAMPQSNRYQTISQFYDAIRRGLVDLSAELGEERVFCGDPARQLTEELHYGGSGRIIAVHDLATAVQALDEIVAQGEGADHVHIWDGDHEMFHPERDEVGHFYRFRELELGRRYRRGDTPQSGPTGEPIAVDWDGVRPMRPNPKTSDHPPGSPIRHAEEHFNVEYCNLLQLLELVFNGSPRLLDTAVGAMYALKSLATALLLTADGDLTAGLTFEYVAPARRFRSEPS
jgi:hypothetical protein